jgi:hypothetical protein
MGGHIFCNNRVGFALNETFFATLVHYGSKSGIFHDFLIRIDFASNEFFYYIRTLWKQKRD